MAFVSGCTWESQRQVAQAPYWTSGSCAFYLERHRLPGVSWPLPHLAPRPRKGLELPSRGWETCSLGSSWHRLTSTLSQLHFAHQATAGKPKPQAPTSKPSSSLRPEPIPTPTSQVRKQRPREGWALGACPWPPSERLRASRQRCVHASRNTPTP